MEVRREAGAEPVADALVALLERCGDSGDNKASFAKAINYKSQGSLSAYFQGTRMLTERTLIAILRHYKDLSQLAQDNGKAPLGPADFEPLVYCWISVNGLPGRELRVVLKNAGVPWSDPAAVPSDRPRATVVRGPATVEPSAPASEAGTAGSPGRHRMLAVGLGILVTATATIVAVSFAWPSRSAERTPVSHTFDASHQGPVTVTLYPSEGNEGERHRIDLQWGSSRRTVTLDVAEGGRTIEFAKMRPDAVPLRVESTPTVTVTFGQEHVPGALDVNAGWDVEK